MSRAVALALIGAMGLVVAPVAARNDSPSGVTGDGADWMSVVATHRLLRARLDHIADGSRLWRAGLDAVRRSGRQAIVVTPEQVVVADQPNGTARAFDPSVVAETAPVPKPNARVDVVLVVVNLPLIEEAHRRNRSLPGELYVDLDRILIHEVYGHAVPYLVAGHLSGRCPDPLPNERPVDACSIQRENAVRQELRLGRRTDYGLSGLGLARSFR